MKRMTEILFACLFTLLGMILFGMVKASADGTTLELLPMEVGQYAKPVFTKVHDEESEITIWNELSKYSPNDQITAGVMGYFWKESLFRSNAVAGWDVRNRWKDQETDICVEFTETVDAGLKRGDTKDYFMDTVIVHYGGYGLGQWLSPDYLEDLYEFAREKGASVGDARLQCAFIFQSLQKNERLWEELLGCRTAEQCGRRIGTLYDGNDEAGAELIASAAGLYYKKFHEKGAESYER